MSWWSTPDDPEEGRHGRLLLSAILGPIYRQYFMNELASACGLGGRARVIGVEPTGAPTLTAALRAGRPGVHFSTYDQMLALADEEVAAPGS